MFLNRPIYEIYSNLFYNFATVVTQYTIFYID